MAAIQRQTSHFAGQSATTTAAASATQAVASSAVEAAALLLYPVAYVLGIRFGMFAYVGQEVSSFWPNSGLLSGALLILPRQRWPLLFVVSVLADTIFGGALVGRSALQACLLGGVNCMEAALVASAILTWLHGRRFLDRLSGVLAFAGAVALAVTLGGALGALVVTEFYPDADYFAVWRSWAAADGLGHLIVAPLVLGLAQAKRVLPDRWTRWLELGLAFATTVVLAQVFFSGSYRAAGALALLVMLPAFLTALRFDLAWTVMLAAIVVVLAVVHTALGEGPFVAAADTPILQAHALQAFLVGMVLTALSVGAALRERHDALLLVHEQRRQLEQTVAERTAQLRVANEGLRAFNHSLAHDLRGPLHVMTMTLELLRLDKQLAGSAAAQVRDLFSTVVRMNGLVSDMLRLSSAAHAVIEPVSVDLSTMAREIAAELQASAPGRNVEFAIAPELRVTADRGLMRIALSNLLGNAHKYSSKRVHARVEFYAEDQLDGRRFCVKDNGVGFDARDLDKVFAPFQRLHSSADFPGSGIGLSTVKRIIEHHGGTIGAEGCAGLGATFWFTIPSARPL